MDDVSQEWGLAHSIPINLFIKLRLNVFPVRSMLSFSFIPESLWAYLRKVSGGKLRKVL